MAEFTAEQVEAIDLSDFTAAQRAEIAPTLYAVAPGTDSLARRQWVADRLRIRISEINRVLHSHGIRWQLRPLRKPARQTPPAEQLEDSSTGLPDLSFALDDRFLADIDR
jgi:hypothetical protein